METVGGIASTYCTILDVFDLKRSAAFWFAVLGSRETHRGGPYLVLSADGKAFLGLQKSS